MKALIGADYEIWKETAIAHLEAHGKVGSFLADLLHEHDGWAKRWNDDKKDPELRKTKKEPGRTPWEQQ